jgi:hypothetical protein
MRKKYNSEYFIKKFSKIPRDKWTTEQLHDDSLDASCALGHCGMLTYKKPTEEAGALIDLFRGALDIEVEDVNDNTYYNDFDGRNPRTRILNALKKAKNKGY